MRTTHTFAVLDVSPAAFAEISEKLKAAGYAHAIFESDGRTVIDMHGIALGVAEQPERDPVTTKPDGAPRHPGTAGVLKHFRFAHLPAHLQEVSRPCGELAFRAADTLPEGPDLTCGLRDLLAAKDNFVRSRLG